MRGEVDILTYQDLIKAGEDEQSRAKFVYKVISEHQASQIYQDAADAELYAKGQNATISKYQKLLYKITGEAVPDNYTANHKCKSGFFKRFVTQEAAYEVGNGVNLKSDEIKDKLGKNFDAKLYFGVKHALIEGVSFGFFNNDHVKFFKLTEFAPLWDEDDGTLKAGVRFYQIDSEKPLMATLYEIDGYTQYEKGGKAGDEPTVKEEKRPYIQIVTKSAVSGEQVTGGENYAGFPIIPLWANGEHQSELEGHRENIDCYDLIKSGFANDLDDASMIYWTLQNAGGMNDIDLAQFIERMKTLHAAVVGNEETDGVKAEAHTIDVPYQSRQAYLEILEKDLYKDFMALDVEKITAGATTATQIRAAYEPLNEKADELEMCLFDFFTGLLSIAGIQDTPSFERSMISNQTEYTEMVLSAAGYLDSRTILEKLPFLTADEIEDIIKRKENEEVKRFNPDIDNPDESEDSDEDEEEFEE